MANSDPHGVRAMPDEELHLYAMMQGSDVGKAAHARAELDRRAREADREIVDRQLRVSRGSMYAAIAATVAAFLLLIVTTIQTFASEPLEGEARIVDGDTLVIAGERIRLHGIDAPETRQTCGETACGREATAALVEMIDARPVLCRGDDRDRYGRLIAVCFVGDVEINRAMVRAGHALAYRRYSRRYIAAEAAAQDQRAGMWAGDFVPPWEWRRRVR